MSNLHPLPQPDDDPFEAFALWFDEAKAAIDKDPNAMCVSTANKEGRPSSRIVLLKEFDQQGFVFYTNYTGRKSLELDANPYAALNFYWRELDKQIRIEGKVEKVAAEESDAYFDSRPRTSRIGAWASKQSTPLAGGTKQLLKDVAAYTAKFGTKKVPRPDHWGGWRVIPHRIEFWHQREFRLHERIEFTRKNENDTSWSSQYLYP